jgi:hypothetical protein
MMPLLIGGAIGAGVGAIGGAVGGYLSGAQQERDARRLRKAIRTGVMSGQMETARQVGTTMSTPEYLAATQFARGMYGIQGDPRADLYSTLQGIFGPGPTAGVGFNWEKIQNRGVLSTQDFTTNFLQGRFGLGEPGAAGAFGVGRPQTLGATSGLVDQRMGQLQDRIDRILWQGKYSRQGEPTRDLEKWRLSTNEQALLGNYQKEYNAGLQAQSTYDQAANLFEGRPGGPADVLSQDFAKQIQTAQAARGLYSSQAGAAAEASGLAAHRTQLQMQMLPMLLQLAENPLRMSQTYGTANLQTGVFANTGGQAVYGQVNPATFGGAGAMAGALSGGIAGFTGGLQAGMGLGGMIQQGGLNEQQSQMNQLQLLQARQRVGSGGGVPSAGMGMPYPW